VKAWGKAPGKEELNFEALKARHNLDDQYFAPSALARLQAADLGRWPRLSHFARWEPGISTHAPSFALVSSGLHKLLH
jgi:hypothetical protein